MKLISIMTFDFEHVPRNYREANMEDLGQVIFLAAVLPGALTGLIGGWRGGTVTALLSAIAGGVCGLGLAMLFSSLLTQFGGFAREGIAAPVALIGGSLLGGMLAVMIVKRLR